MERCSPSPVPEFTELPLSSRCNSTILTLHLFSNRTPSSIDHVVSDFDHAVFHISTPESKTRILISLSIKCFPDLNRYGATTVLQRHYGSYIVKPEPGYDFSIELDLDNLPADEGVSSILSIPF